jgi:hypothetical protein
MRNSRLFSPALLVLVVIGSLLATSPAAAFAGRAWQDKPSTAAQSATTTSIDTELPAAQPLDLTDQVVRDILSHLQRGIETHNASRVLVIFDQQSMPNYDEVRNQLSAFFRYYDTIQFRYQVLQVMAEKDHGFATADIDMDATPGEYSQVPVRRTLQIRFQLKLTPKGWKVIGFTPGDLFAQ